MKLSEHFELSEFTRSQTATRRRIVNNPSPKIIENIKLLCEKVLEPIREIFKRPIIITSGYRCPELNTLIGGAKNSQHQFGQAADFYVLGLTCEQAFTTLRQDEYLPFDQLILENPSEDGWIHISYHPTNRRRDIMIADLRHGKTYYNYVQKLPQKVK